MQMKIKYHKNVIKNLERKQNNMVQKQKCIKNRKTIQ